ncbi:MAG: hypothetical protein GKR97_18670 [Rhizobiaceae bacterium]|nr:hypothetical protein [Rhizobiaceae bacterium]
MPVSQGQYQRNDLCRAGLRAPVRNAIAGARVVPQRRRSATGDRRPATGKAELP